MKEKSNPFVNREANHKECDADLRSDIFWSIYRVKRIVPWENVCRHQAYQAMILCIRYSISYEIFIGFKRNSETDEIEGHAWVISNKIFLAGNCIPSEYIIQQVFVG